MSPAVLVGFLGPAAIRLGLEEYHAWLVHRGDAVSLVDILELIEAIEERVVLAIGRELPESAHRARAARILELAEAGQRDPEIAETTGASVETVRAVRRRAGVAGHPKPRARSGWEERIRELRARGMDADEIVAETGWARRTVLDRIGRLNRTERDQAR